MAPIIGRMELSPYPYGAQYQAPKPAAITVDQTNQCIRDAAAAIKPLGSIPSSVPGR